MHVLFSWLFVLKLDWQITGTGVAGILTNLIVFSINCGYCFCDEEIRPALLWPGSYIFEGVWSYLEIGIPAAIMVLLEGCGWHLMTFTVGYFGVSDQSTQIVLMSIVVSYY